MKNKIIETRLENLGILQRLFIGLGRFYVYPVLQEIYRTERRLKK